jgi:hypothetical protein
VYKLIASHTRSLPTLCCVLRSLSLLYQADITMAVSICTLLFPHIRPWAVREAITKVDIGITNANSSSNDTAASLRITSPNEQTRARKRWIDQGNQLLCSDML